MRHRVVLRSWRSVPRRRPCLFRAIPVGDSLKGTLKLIGLPRTICWLTIVTMFALPRLPLFDALHLFTPADQTFMHWYIGISAVLSYCAFFGFFMWGNFKVAYAGLGIIIGILAFGIAAICGLMASFSGEQFYSYYELVYLPHETRNMLYAVPSISIGGRGGYHALVSPYGLRTWGLPLSKADYRAYHAGTLIPPNLCYRVTELRRGGVIGIIEPSRWNTPDALVHCHSANPRWVGENTPRPI